MWRWLGFVLLAAVLLGSLNGCRGSEEPAKTTEPLPNNRFPHKR